MKSMIFGCAGLLALTNVQLLAVETPVLQTESGIPLDAPWKVAVFQFAKSNLQHSAWGLAHAERDFQLATTLAEQEKLTVDLDVLFAAAFLHDIRGVHTTTRRYRYTGSIPVEPPSRLDEASEYERHFISEVERYCEFVRALHNAFRIVDGQEELTTDEFWRDPKKYLRTQELWHWNALGQIEEHLNLREKFKTIRPLPVIERTSLEQQTKQVESGFHDMFVTGVRSAIALMLPRLDPLQNLQTQWFSHNGNLFDGGVIAVRRAIQNQNPLCVFSPLALKQIAIVSGEPDTIRRLSGSLKEFQETHWVVGVGDFEGAGRSGSGVHFINTNNPEALQSSVQKFLKAAKLFFPVRPA